jgi:predicted nuclease with RNAse H fold
VALTDRLGLKATALLLAIMLWIVVSARQPTEGLVNVRVIPVLDRSLVLVDSPSTVRAQVYGRAVDIVKLYTAPPVLRLVVRGTGADSFVREITPGDIRISSQVGEEVHVLDVQPRTVTLHVAPRSSRP